MSFSERLLEATGFENHYLVNTLGGMRGASIVGRLHAVGRKRVGPIDYILRNIPDILGSVIEDIGDTVMSIVSWNVAGTPNTGTKKYATHRLVLESDLSPILGLELEGRELAWISLEDIHPANYLPAYSALAKEPEEEQDEAFLEYTFHMQQHPVFRLAEQIAAALLTVETFKYLGTDSYIEPSVWYYSWVGPNNDVQYLSIRVDADAVDEEIRAVVN